MASKLQTISANQFITDYAQGKAQTSMQPVADFIAPTVAVPFSTGRFKVYSERYRFKIAKTERGPGGRAVEIGMDQTDGAFNCEAHAIDVPVDVLELDAGANALVTMQDAADLAAAQGALSHEKKVISMAVANATNTAVTWTSGSTDIVAQIDAKVLAVIKTAAAGSGAGVGIVFGPTAWMTFRNNATVRGRFVVGSGNTRIGGQPVQIVDENAATGLFIGNPMVKVAYIAEDTAADGQTPSMSFLMDDKVLIFARTDNPTRRDPSFMKTFRLSGKFMVPGSYSRDDGRVEVAKFDWSEDVKVTNAPAGAMLTVS